MSTKESSGPEQFSMRSRAARTSSNEGLDNPTYKDIVYIERKVKNGDTLNNLAIKYQVNVAEIKRVNNMVSEQDFLAFSKVKIPVSRMRIALGMQSSSQDEDEGVLIDVDDRTHLLRDDSKSRDPSVEDIFHKTDSNIAQVREALPEDGINTGSFHFVTARDPYSTSFSVWAVVLGVLLIFCVLPLVLTYYEEQEESLHIHKTTHAA